MNRRDFLSTLSVAASSNAGCYDGRYIYSQGLDNVLYDHATDPHELSNLIDHSPDLVARKKKQLHAIMQQTGHPEPNQFEI